MKNNPAYTLRMQLTNLKSEYTTLKDSITIGRHAICDLPFPNSTTVSRNHAVIFYRDGVWYLKDTGSANGTWPNKMCLLHTKCLRQCLKPAWLLQSVCLHRQR